MGYHDVNYYIKSHNGEKLAKSDIIEDVYIQRRSHYCEETGEYWNNKKDESIYLKVRTKEGMTKQVFLAENTVNEHDIDFDDPTDEIAFYKGFRNSKFYNFVDIYENLSVEQSVQFLDIMTKNSDDDDYNLQYCDKYKVIRGIVHSHLDTYHPAVERAYNKYLKCEQITAEELYQQELGKMFQDGTKNNVINFDSRRRVSK